MTKNAQRYLELQSEEKIIEAEEVFEIESSSDSSKKYKVIKMDGVWYCDCASFKYRSQCKHIDKAKENYGKK